MDAWTSVCRCCLSPNAEIDLFDAEEKLNHKFVETTSIEAKLDDGLPQRLCFQCSSLMDSAYQFRRQCIKMDEDLKSQLRKLLENEDNMEVDGQSEESDDDPLKTLEALIKSEPNYSDDDSCYVVIIDDKKDGTTNHEEAIAEIQKQFNLNEQEIKVENQTQEYNSYESFVIPDTKVPDNVPATILANEEESQDTDIELPESHAEEHQNTDGTDAAQQIDEMTVNDIDNVNIENINVNNFLQSLPSQNSFIKIISADSNEGTLLLSSADNITYLAEANMEEDDQQKQVILYEGEAQLDDEDSQKQVILYEGDDSQLQIVRCDPSNLVLHYTEDGLLALYQNDDGSMLCHCGESFTDIKEYQEHQLTHNPGNENLCNLCGKGFDTAEILTGHLLLHSDSGLVVNCPFCDQGIRRNTLTQHIKFSHNKVKPSCRLCFKTFANQNNLKRHMMIHNGIKEFECDICFKRFHQKITMQTHRLTHVDPLACKHCDLCFNTKDELEDHINSEKCTKSKLHKFREEIMSKIKQKITSNTGKMLGYQCNVCQKKFSVEAVLDEHIQNEHMADSQELLCPDCGEMFTTVKEMQCHTVTHKTIRNKNLKRFPCSFCGKFFASQAMLVMHARVHTNERPYPCQLCSLRFKTKTHLRTHQLTHTRERKYGCSICMKFFALKGNLVVHLRTHTGERPYVCTVCNEAFIDSKYLKKHKVKKHSIENVDFKL